jgi:hypothetical protein
MHITDGMLARGEEFRILRWADTVCTASSGLNDLCVTERSKLENHYTFPETSKKLIMNE